MQRTVIVMPGLLGENPEDSPLLQNLPTLRALSEMGELKRLAATPAVETPEAMWLGMPPNLAQMRQGPLTVAALGADPPDRSVHFHLTLAGHVDGQVVAPPRSIPPGELRELLERAKKLNTRSLTVVPGEDCDHGLVWEGVGELHTVAWDSVVGQPLRTHLPEGDGERELRRLIDDSINLLSELELNERRQDEGLPPLNLFWPWGHGPRLPVPNLLLQRGERAAVFSGSMRLAGLSRLAGYRHADPKGMGAGINAKMDQWARDLLREDLAILVAAAPGDLRAAGQMEEAHWFLKELDQRLLLPLFDAAVRERSRIVLIATGVEGGLGLAFEPLRPMQNVYPFDERSLEERTVERLDLWTYVAQGLKPVGPAVRPVAQ